MNRKQKIAIVTPLILVVFMYPVFQLASWAYGNTIGWYLGLLIYWIIWGMAFPVWIIGKDSIKKLIRSQKPNKKVILLVAIPLVLALFGRIFMGMEYRKENVLALIFLIGTAFGNGFFEEVLWRGVYMELFPNENFFRIIWPSVFFALWHFAPGSVSSNSNVLALIIGAGFFGIYLSYLAKKTNTIWWSIVTHTIGGIIMVL